MSKTILVLIGLILSSVLTQAPPPVIDDGSTAPPSAANTTDTTNTTDFTSNSTTTSASTRSNVEASPTTPQDRAAVAGLGTAIAVVGILGLTAAAVGGGVYLKNKKAKRSAAIYAGPTNPAGESVIRDGAENGLLNLPYYEETRMRSPFLLEDSEKLQAGKPLRQDRSFKQSYQPLRDYFKPDPSDRSPLVLKERRKGQGVVQVYERKWAKLNKEDRQIELELNRLQTEQTELRRLNDLYSGQIGDIRRKQALIPNLKEAQRMDREILSLQNKIKRKEDQFFIKQQRKQAQLHSRRYKLEQEKRNLHTKQESALGIVKENIRILKINAGEIPTDLDPRRQRRSRVEIKTRYGASSTQSGAAGSYFQSREIPTRYPSRHYSRERTRYFGAGEDQEKRKASYGTSERKSRVHRQLDPSSSEDQDYKDRKQVVSMELRRCQKELGQQGRLSQKYCGELGNIIARLKIEHPGDHETELKKLIKYYNRDCYDMHSSLPSIEELVRSIKRTTKGTSSLKKTRRDDFSSKSSRRRFSRSKAIKSGGAITKPIRPSPPSSYESSSLSSLQLPFDKQTGQRRGLRQPRRLAVTFADEEDNQSNSPGSQRSTRSQTYR